jgi:hypothetical protein
MLYFQKKKRKKTNIENTKNALILAKWMTKQVTHKNLKKTIIKKTRIQLKARN